ncbi:MAG: hypothetical protein QNJ78_10990 [Gammaproteobacteria bacterium]|nr:hypothetical protein [Gammaproteobacteria bacterium]
MKLEQRPLRIFTAASLVLFAAEVLSSPDEGGGGPPRDPEFDAKTYRATGCQARPIDLVIYENGGICNPENSPSEVEVTCPIVRDNTENEDGANIVVNVGVSDSPIECTAYSWGTHWSETEKVSDATSGWGFISIFLQLTESTPGGSYSLSCILPPDMSCVYGYKVWEWEGSDDNMTDNNR